MRVVLNRAGPHLVVAAAFLALALLFLWPLPLDGGGKIIGGDGDPLLELWTLCWNDHWFSGEAPSYFDANICHPEKNSLAFADHLFSQALLFIPLYRLTGNPVLGYNLLLALSLALSGFGVYLCGRSLGLSVPVSLAAGILFAFFPFRTAQIKHLHILSTQWLPFSFYFLLGVLRSRRLSWKPLSLFTLFSILHVLCSFYQALVWALLTGITVTVFIAGRRLNRQQIGGLICAALLIGAALAPFAPAYFEVSRHYQIVRSLEENIRYSAKPEDFVHPSHFSLLHRGVNSLMNSRDTTVSRSGEHQLYPGAVFIILLLGGLVALFRARNCPAAADRETRLVWFALLASALASLVLAFGPAMVWGAGEEKTVLPLPYSLLYHWLPGIKGLRVPARLVLLFHFSGALLAGLGLQRWLAGRSKAFARCAVSLVAVLVLLEGISLKLPVTALPLPRSMPQAYRDIRQLPADTVLLELPTQPEYLQFRPMYNSIFHFRALANGRSGIVPPVTRRLIGLTNPNKLWALGPALLDHMLSNGINTVLLHRNWGHQKANLLTVERLNSIGRFKVIGRYENGDILLRLAAKAGREEDVSVLRGTAMAPLPFKRVPLEAAAAYPSSHIRALRMEEIDGTLRIEERVHFCWMANLPQGDWQLWLHLSGLDRAENEGRPVLLWAKVAGHEVLTSRRVEEAGSIRTLPVKIAQPGYYRISAFVQGEQPAAPLSIDLERVKMVPVTPADEGKQASTKSRIIE